MSELYLSATPIEEADPDRRPNEWPMSPIDYDDVDGDIPSGFGPINADAIDIDG
jgi:hypothetical protein